MPREKKSQEEKDQEKINKLLEKYAKANSALQEQQGKLDAIVRQIKELDENNGRWSKLHAKENEIAAYKKSIKWKKGKQGEDSHLVELEGELENIGAPTDSKEKREYNEYKRALKGLELQRKFCESDNRSAQEKAEDLQSKLDKMEGFSEQPIAAKERVEEGDALTQPKKRFSLASLKERLGFRKKEPDIEEKAKLEGLVRTAEEEELPLPLSSERSPTERRYQVSERPQVFATEGDFIYSILKQHIQKTAEEERASQPVPSGAAPGEEEIREQVPEELIASKIEELLVPENLKLINKVVRESIQSQLEDQVLVNIEPVSKSPKEREYTFEDGEKIIELEKAGGLLDFTASSKASGTISIARMGDDGNLLEDVDIITYDNGRITGIIPGTEGKTRVANLSDKVRQAKEHAAEQGGEGVAVIVEGEGRDGSGIEVVIPHGPQAPQPTIEHKQVPQVSVPTSLFEGITAITAANRPPSPQATPAGAHTKKEDRRSK